MEALKRRGRKITINTMRMGNTGMVVIMITIWNFVFRHIYANCG